MRIVERREGNVIVLTPVGRVDNETSSVFQAKLTEVILPGMMLVIDMAGVEFISSAGLAALMTALEKAKAADSGVAVASLRPIVQEIFSISRLSSRVPLFDMSAMLADRSLSCDLA
jgi:anti-anti-sigma factor